MGVMSPLLVVPLKKTAKVDISEPLEYLFNNSYNGNNAKAIDNSNAIEEFNKLRNNALIRPRMELHSLETIYNYYDQLCTLELKLPMHELQVPFTWKDAFGKRFLCDRTSLTQKSLNYEKLCVLFNIAAMQSAVAASQGTHEDDGLILAIKLFQQSAGIFAHLKCAVRNEELTPDLSPDVLHVLSNLMLAQAQEIFVLKAFTDASLKSKNASVAKLANSCQKLYAKVVKHSEKHMVKSILDKNWISMIVGKQAAFRAITEMYQSRVCRKNKAYGEEIARLQHSVQLFKKAQSLTSKRSMYYEFIALAEHDLKQSTKDNDFIYHENVPDIKSLTEPDDGQLAKILPFTLPLSLASKDLFVHVVPVVSNCVTLEAETRKNCIIDIEMMSLHKATEKLNEFLTNSNLPGDIEVVIGSTLPRSILNKSRDIRKRGGISSLQQLINALPEMVKCNQDILDEIDRMLNEEAENDSRLRMQFKKTWTRAPSEELTKTIRLNISRYREIIHNALETDKSILKIFDKHAHGIETLSKPINELENECPISSDKDIANCSSIQKIRKLMKIVDLIKIERAVLQSEMNSVKIKNQFLGKNINGSENLDDSITKMFDSLRKRVQQSISQQNIIIEEIQTACNTFKNESAGRSVARDAFLIEMAKTYDCYLILQKKLKEGQQFYNNLAYLLNTFEIKVLDFCSARKSEEISLVTMITK